MRVAFVGLGTMGRPMALNLIAKGHDLAVYDINKRSTERFDKQRCRIAASPSDAARDAEVVITMLPSSREVREAVLGPSGAVSAMRAGVLFIDMSTGSASESALLAGELADRGIRMLDAPVGRTPHDAERRTLMIIVGGREDDVAFARPLFEAMGDTIHHMGPSGCGIRTKLVNNYMSMVNILLVAEALTLAAKCGLDRSRVVQVLSGTTAGRGQLSVNYPKKVLAGDITPDFPLRMGLKDIGLALDLGAEVGAPLSLGSTAREYFALAKSWGREEQDCTAMLLLLEDIARVATTSKSHETNLSQQRAPEI
jgi:4-hydroxybutyrate dehydrogenase/sulfolactaldehyde 3-reductase